MKKPFKLRSQGSSFKMIGASPLKIEKSVRDSYKENQRRIAGNKVKNIFSTKNLLRFGRGVKNLTIAGVIEEGAIQTLGWMGRSWNKAENVKMNAPENAKYAEWYHGPSNKSKNIGKTTQIKKGDKIEATGPENY